MSTWASITEVAMRLEQDARNLRILANKVRCMAEESGGERCTADATKEHAHRVADADRPRLIV